MTDPTNDNKRTGAATDPQAAIASQEAADAKAQTNHYAGEAIAAEREEGSVATPRETWFDILPAGAPRPALDALLSREELLEELHRRGADVTSVTLVFWEKSGVLPRAVRRYRGGRAHAMYPPFAVSAIAQVRDWQTAGRSLEEVMPLVRTLAASSVPWHDPLAEPLATARAGVIPIARAYHAAAARVTLLDEDGTEVAAHEFPVPPE